MEKEVGGLMADQIKPVYILGDNVITSLGFTTAENISSIKNDTIGIRAVDNPALYPSAVQLSLVPGEKMDRDFAGILQPYKNPFPAGSYTRLEKMLILSVHDALTNGVVSAADPKTLLVISTTKGNIDLLENQYKVQFSHKRLYLWELARVIGSFFGFVNPPVIISNACISGLVAIMTATRFLQSGAYDHAVVAGGDIVSEFVISGFQSFQALSPHPCKPFDINRTGLSLGEGCGTMILSAKPRAGAKSLIRVAGAATSNDANHISGPSRTGEELAWAMHQAMLQARIAPGEIDYISAHGTATPFNDEMESKALGIAGLSDVPVNSFKGYWGHTLGAAGIIESVAAVSSLRSNFLYRSAGFETLGVPEAVNVTDSHRPAELKSCLKTASGFGGCNAAILYRKD